MKANGTEDSDTNLRSSDHLNFDKGTKVNSGEKVVSSINFAGKTRHLHAENRN
jgi:hypothetical protein